MSPLLYLSMCVHPVTRAQRTIETASYIQGYNAQVGS